MIDIRSSELFEFLGVVRHLSDDPAEADVMKQVLESMMGFLESIDKEANKWFPDTHVLRSTQVCETMVTIISTLQKYAVQYGDEFVFIKKMSQSAAIICDKLSKKNEGDLADIYSNLRAQITQRYGEN